MIRKIRPRARVSLNLLKVASRGTDQHGGFAPYTTYLVDENLEALWGIEYSELLDFRYKIAVT